MAQLKEIAMSERYLLSTIQNEEQNLYQDFGFPEKRKRQMRMSKQGLKQAGM